MFKSLLLKKMWYCVLTYMCVKPERLEASGAEVVLNGAIMAIIGAITLQHGSVVASRIIRERILARMTKA